jgi:gliding motility-associated-like protein
MKKIVLLLFLFCSGLMNAQLIIDESMTPEQLVQNVLVDPASVTPFNITLAGGASNVVRLQTAKFSTNFNPTNLGLDTGVILATGRAQIAIGPNTVANKTEYLSTTGFNDPDLQIISGSTLVSNCTILEFDFVATGEELNFDFIFASEEYPEYVNNSYNDSFGFFLSGPGISGPFSNNAANIALIPGTTTGVSINTVNNGPDNDETCTNCEYYVDNDVVFPADLNSTIQYDGFTTVLKAVAPLTCGETYHIKLAVGNVGDDGFDSAVFLKNFEIKPLELVDNLNLSENTNVCFGQTVTISSNILPANKIFTWTKDMLPIAESGPEITVTEGGLYALTVTTLSGCVLAYDDILIAFRAEIPVEQPANIEVCFANSPPYIFTNINQTTAVLNGLNPSNYDIMYYDSSFDDALNATSVGVLTLSELNNYEIASATQTIWIRIEETFLGSGSCVVVKSFQLNAETAGSGTIAYSSNSYCTLTDTPQLPTQTATPLGIYSSTPAGLFIDSVSGAITPSLSTPGTYIIKYTKTDDICPDFVTPEISILISASLLAPSVSSPLVFCQNEVAPNLTAVGNNLLWYSTATINTPLPAVPIPNTSIVGNISYFVSQSGFGCESHRSEIIVTVIAIPSPPTVTSPLSYCENQTAPALTAVGNGLLWYSNPTSGTGSIVEPAPDTSTIGQQIFYVSQTINGCESTKTAITVTVTAQPLAPQVTSSTGYCQNVAAAQLTASGTNLLWYDVATGSIGNSAAPTPNTTATGTTTFYVSQTVNGCESPRAAITVTISTAPVKPTTVQNLAYCENETAPVLSAVGTNLLWYTTADGGVGSTTAPVPQTNTPGSTLYYVSQTVNGCESIRTEITVYITGLPTIQLPQDGSVCFDFVTTTLISDYTLSTGSFGNYTVEWFVDNGGSFTVIPFATENNYQVTVPGLYGVQITDIVSGCKSDISTATVGTSFPPVSMTVTVSDYFDETKSILVDTTPPGTYEYQVDYGPFQVDSTFRGLASGSHTVTVRDLNNCGEITQDFLLIGYPKFFTPNADGYNDTWNVSELNNQLDAKIHIFDRYGKLIKQIFPSGAGWDGTYNGNVLPATDYWFVLYYTQNGSSKELRAHFSLKR